MKNWSWCRIPIIGITPNGTAKVTFLPINQNPQPLALPRGDIDHRILPENMYQKLLKDIPGQVYMYRRTLGTYYYAFATRKRPTADPARSSGIKYDDESPPDDRKSIRTGEKPAWHFTPDVTAGFTPEPCRLNK